jgi:hypothetical protein
VQGNIKTVNPGQQPLKQLGSHLAVLTAIANHPSLGGITVRAIRIKNAFPSFEATWISLQIQPQRFTHIRQLV